MTALAAILALALSAAPSDSPRRTADSTNASRARAGLLPRKAARTHVEVRRLRTVSAPAPTFLGEPAPLADAPPDGDAAWEPAEPLARASGDAPAAVPMPVVVRQLVPVRQPVAAAPAPRVAARGRIETVRLRESGPASVAIVAPAAEPIAPRIVAPEELGAVRVALLGVSTEVTLRLRFDDP